MIYSCTVDKLGLFEQQPVTRNKKKRGKLQQKFPKGKTFTICTNNFREISAT